MDSNIESSMDNKSETRTNLIINYLPQTLKDDEFFKSFVAIGPIKSSRIVRDMKTGYSFGFGFIEYESPENAAQAIAQLNNLPMEHKRIKVSYARPPGEEIKGTNLYIQNIPKTFTIDDLGSLFDQFGTIVQKHILRNKANGQSKGVGFIRFDKKDEADSAIENMNGYHVDNHTPPLVVRIAEEHGKMKAAYYAGFQAGKVMDDMPSSMPSVMSPFMGRGGGGGGGGLFGNQRGGFGGQRGFGGGGRGNMVRAPRGGMNSFGGSGKFGRGNGLLDDEPQFPMPLFPGRGGFNNMSGKLPPFRSNKRFNPMDRSWNADMSQPHSGYRDFQNQF